MALMITVAALLVINMLLTHADKLIALYYWLYKKMWKPKFKTGEFVMIDNQEYEIMYVLKNDKPYTYFCLPTIRLSKHSFSDYYHESRIKKKTGLLKELE